MTDADCPRCGSEGFVTARTEPPAEAECLTEDCPVVIFEVRDL